MIDSSIKKEILKRLSNAEKEHNIKILYACESGSRAWGFASTDSDYDVRFIYVHPQDWYLSFDIEKRRDVIEYPIVDEIDCSGWDIRKALYLFTRSNGALLEWLNSPIKYIERGSFSQNLRDFAPKAINQIALSYHYNHMAKRNAREYLFKDQVRLKKYFYVLRPLLAIKYIEKYNAPPPVEFEKLFKTVAPASIHSGVKYLLDLKRNSPEVGMVESIAEINSFIRAELEQYEFEFSGEGRPDLLTKKEFRDRLNQYFREAISQS